MSVTIRLYGVRLTQCSYVDAFVVDLVIHGCPLYGSITLRMSTRRLPVILFVFSFRVTVISCCLLHGVPVVAEEVYCLIAPDGVSIFYDFFIVFYLLSSSRRLHRLSANLTARAYIRVVMLTVFVMTLAIIIICQFAALLPLVTSQAWLRSDVLEPQPGYNCWRKPYVPGSGCSGPVSSGPFRFPP